MFKNQSADVHRFAMTPRADIPRSVFKIEHTHKLTFDAGYLVPIYVDEVLPGDTFNCRLTALCRLATPLYPLMDNLYLDTFFFFVPARLVWDNWRKFMGEQANPGDSISYVIPKVNSPNNGWPVGSLADYMGLPTVGQLGAGNFFESSALPLRCYNLIWNEWFRDENLQNAVNVSKGDGPDNNADYNLLRRGKRHDYFTSCLPWPQKGTAVPIPMPPIAPVMGISVSGAATQSASVNYDSRGNSVPVGTWGWSALRLQSNTQSSAAASGTVFPSIYADLTAATGNTINALRQAFQIQKLLERDARGGTRYSELIKSHFGVTVPDYRLQRPEYIGGGTAAVMISPVSQNSATGLTGGSAPLGTLGAVGTAVSRGAGFNSSFSEHGYIIGLASVRADLTYQQGVRRLWKRNTRYDFYFPAFAHLGEQAVYNYEIYARGNTVDNDVFGYQERWSDYRYHPSRISGLFRSTASGTLDAWHAAQKFTILPTLNDTFIQDNPPLSRNLAVGAAANGAQLIGDFFFSARVARVMPAYSVPGLLDHF